MVWCEGPAQGAGLSSGSKDLSSAGKSAFLRLQAKPVKEDASPTRERSSQAAEQALRSELSSQVSGTKLHPPARQ